MSAEVTVSFAEVVAAVRRKGPGAGVAGASADGRPVYYARHGYVLADRRLAGDAGGEFIVQVGAAALTQVTLAAVEDDVLEAVGLFAHRLRPPVPADAATPGGWERRAIATMTGIALRVLDISRDHLAHRESGGVKTLQHQLVKATFADCISAVELVTAVLADDAMLPLDADDVSYPTLGDELTAALRGPLTLMGGHGYLISGTAPLGYAAEVIRGLL